MKTLQLQEQIELIDIKSRSVTESELDRMKELSGSFESLFSKKAIKYRSLGLNNQNLNELDFKRLILEEYTFLKRPVLVIDDNIVMGNSKEAIDKMLKLSEQIK